MSQDVESYTVFTIKNIALIATPYVICVGLSYLWGFWGVFDVNILEYAGITDVVATAIYPMVFGLVVMMAGYISGEISSSRSHKVVVEMLPPREVTAGFFKKYGEIIALGYLIFLALLMDSDIYARWKIFPFLVAMPLAIVIVSNSWLNISKVEKSTQATFYFLVFFIPLMGFGQGRVDGTEIRTGIKFAYVVAANAGPETIKGQHPKRALRSIGHVNEFDFFYDPIQDAVSIAKTQDESSLTLKRYVKPRMRYEIDWDLIRRYWDNLLDNK